MYLSYSSTCPVLAVGRGGCPHIFGLLTFVLGVLMSLYIYVYMCVCHIYIYIYIYIYI